MSSVGYPLSNLQKRLGFFLKLPMRVPRPLRSPSSNGGQFETIRMEDSESFDTFYAKLSDIVNSSFYLGERIPEHKIVRKVLRSLPEKFQPKVTAIEESKDIDSLKIEELVGSLQTFEMNNKKGKSIAIKYIKEVSHKQ